jgi:hypothetical protein
LLLKNTVAKAKQMKTGRQIWQNLLRKGMTKKGLLLPPPPTTMMMINEMYRF